MVKAGNGNIFVGFTPAISSKAAKTMRDVIRSWRLHLRSDKSLEDFPGCSTLSCVDGLTTMVVIRDPNFTRL